MKDQPEIPRGPRDEAIEALLDIERITDAKDKRRAAERLIDELACHVAELLVLEFEQRGALGKR